ncbi:MAG: hypothetical protein JXC31_06470 [Acholeplasmataceae bacterium]|nr:hypothetical protein [Acholeplasmataceae bacterium]
MSIKCMYHFENVAKFNLFTEILEKTGWNIEKQLLKERAHYYESNSFFNDLKQQFIKNDLTIWPLKDEEVITWIDTLSIMRRVMIQLFRKGIKGEKLNVFMEYPLIYGNHMRTDYLIVYERLIIVLEFGMFNQDEKRSEERYTKKLQDSITHRQVLANIMDSTINVVNYVMIYRPEFDRMRNLLMNENVLYNNEEINLLTSFIINMTRDEEKLSAISQLERVNLLNS